MSAYVGHTSHVARLKKDLPRVSLFIGPSSVGKWTLAEHLRGFNQILESDLLRINLLTKDNARTLVKFASSFPTGNMKLAIIRMTKATPAAFNVILKTLEESHESVRFILIGEDLPISTIVSRAQLFEFGLLSETEITEILVERKGFQPDTAADRAKLAAGQVSRALAVQDSKENKSLVLRALAAFREKDEAILNGVAAQWRDEHTELLSIWCSESITKRWKYFSEEESELPGKGLPLRILMALRAEIRPRLVVRASLMSVLRGNQ